jgi:hypothetical protein
MSTLNPAPQTILFLTANPTDAARPRLSQELRNIGEGLQRSQKRDQFKLEQRWAVHPLDIQRAMLDLEPNILHFSGHSEGEAGIVFENESGNTTLVDGEALASLFKLFSDKLNCIVLNGCYTEVQANVIAQHIPYVIGMNQAIWDKPAITFTVGFYDALGAGRDVEFAFKLGCTAIQLEGIAEHLTPVLIKKPVVDGKKDQGNPNSQPITSISTTQLPIPASQAPNDFEIYKIREYESTINYLIAKATNSFDMILRSGKIMDECFSNFENALQRGCHIRAIFLDRQNTSLIRSMSYESNNSLETLKLNFAYGEIAINQLKDLSVKFEGKFETAMCNHYLPSELVFI